MNVGRHMRQYREDEHEIEARVIEARRRLEPALAEIESRLARSKPSERLDVDVAAGEARARHPASDGPRRPAASDAPVEHGPRIQRFVLRECAPQRRRAAQAVEQEDAGQCNVSY